MKSFIGKLSKSGINSMSKILSMNFINRISFKTFSSDNKYENKIDPPSQRGCEKEQCGCSGSKEDPLEKELKMKNHKIIESINLGKFDDAIDLSEEYLNTIATNYGKEHPFYCSALNNKAFILKTCGEYEEAEEIFKEVIEKYKSIFGENNEKVIISLNNLATSYRDSKKHSEALEIYEKLLKKIESEYWTVEGETTGKLRLNLIANIYNAAGGLYRQLKRFEEAGKLFTKALNIIKPNFGDNTLPYATVLNNMGLNLKDQNRFDEALEKYQKALEIREELLDQTHPDVIAIKSHIKQLKDLITKH